MPAALDAQRYTMVLTKSELIGSLQKEVHILLHLAGKLDRNNLDYRPTPKQRSALELLRYLSMMGPTIIRWSLDPKQDFEVWTKAAKEADTRNFDQALAAIAGQKDEYAALLGNMSDADFRVEIKGFDGSNVSRGAFIVNLVLSGCAAYRTQLFCYLKSCGREELSTYNLWAGMDAPEPAPAAS
jgi:hypothetical protein